MNLLLVKKFRFSRETSSDPLQNRSWNKKEGKKNVLGMDMRDFRDFLKKEKVSSFRRKLKIFLSSHFLHISLILYSKISSDSMIKKAAKLFCGSIFTHVTCAFFSISLWTSQSISTDKKLSHWYFKWNLNDFYFRQLTSTSRERLFSLIFFSIVCEQKKKYYVNLHTNWNSFFSSSFIIIEIVAIATTTRRLLRWFPFHFFALFPFAAKIVWKNQLQALQTKSVRL